MHRRASGREYPPSPRQEPQTERRRRTLQRRWGARPGLPCPTRGAAAVPTPLQERPHALTESSGAPAAPLPCRRGTQPPRTVTGRGEASPGRAAPRPAPPVPARAAAAPHGTTSAGAEDPRPAPAPEARAEGGNRARPSAAQELRHSASACVQGGERPSWSRAGKRPVPPAAAIFPPHGACRRRQSCPGLEAAAPRSGGKATLRVPIIQTYFFTCSSLPQLIIKQTSSRREGTSSIPRQVPFPGYAYISRFVLSIHLLCLGSP